MKDILLKKDLITYLIHEIERVKKTTPQECEYVNGINTKYSAKHSRLR